MKQLALDFVPAARPTLDNFVPGRNVELLQWLRELATTRAGERFVYLWGAPASGRTHLLHAVLEGLRASGARVAFADNTEDLLALDAAAIDAAAVDDVERLSDDAQAVVFNLYNRLREAGGTLLTAGNAPPSRLALREDLVTRLAWGLVYEVHALSDEEKAQALCDHAAARGLPLQPEVVRYLLNHAARDMRTLIAMIESLDRYSLETKRPVNVALARELLAIQIDQ